MLEPKGIGSKQRIQIDPLFRCFGLRGYPGRISIYDGALYGLASGSLFRIDRGNGRALRTWRLPLIDGVTWFGLSHDGTDFHVAGSSRGPDTVRVARISLEAP